MADYWRFVISALQEGADLLEEMIEEKEPFIKRPPQSFEEQLRQEFWRGRCHQARDVMKGLDKVLATVGKPRKQFRQGIQLVVDNTKKDKSTH